MPCNWQLCSHSLSINFNFLNFRMHHHYQKKSAPSTSGPTTLSTPTSMKGLSTTCRQIGKWPGYSQTLCPRGSKCSQTTNRTWQTESWMGLVHSPYTVGVPESWILLMANKVITKKGSTYGKWWGRILCVHNGGEHVLNVSSLFILYTTPRLCYSWSWLKLQKTSFEWWYYHWRFSCGVLTGQVCKGLRLAG